MMCEQDDSDDKGGSKVTSVVRAEYSGLYSTGRIVPMSCEACRSTPRNRSELSIHFEQAFFKSAHLNYDLFR